ncbi:MAG TPA: hypothetical protein VMZ53_14730 [Kofleriaceae bacterium]|nr:hypothetical protein [Kofleriaceae bacterium]
MKAAFVCALALAGCSNKDAATKPRARDAAVISTDAARPPADAAQADAPAAPQIRGLFELPAIKGNTDNLFGSELALSDTELFIGESLAGNGRVHVYAFENDAWKKTATLQPGKTGNFGADVDVDGDTLAVSAIEDRQRGKSAGAVFVFERKAGAWKQTAKLVPDKPNYQFGWQLALSGNTLVVGAPWDAGNAHRGSVFVYERVDGTWKLSTTLVAPTRTGTDLFGYDVAVSGDHIAVGSLSAKGAPKDSGAAYVFERGPDGTWPLVSTLVSDDRSARDSFGNDVALVGDAVIVGAPAHVGGMLRGAVYVFQRKPDGYLQTQRLQPDESQALDYYGDSIAALGDSVVVSAYGTGAAWLYEYRAGTLTQVDYVDGGRGFGSTITLGPDHMAAAMDGRVHGVASFAIKR